MDEIINVQMLQALRLAKGWNRKQLAQMAGIDASIISRLERGLQTDLKVSVLVAIAKALETSVSNLLQNQAVNELANSANLQLLITEVMQLPPDYQKQIEAILLAYISTTPLAPRKIDS
jgi:transcriptional regulator with XRE-family HTH domain